MPAVRRGLRWPVLLIGALAVPLALLVAFSLLHGALTATITSEAAPEDDAAEQRTRLRVTTAVATPRAIERRLRVTGTLVAREEIAIGTAVQGQRLAEVLVEEGARVTAGQLLARLETDILRAQALQAEAGVARARAARAQQAAADAQARASLRRVEGVRHSDAVTAQELDERRSAAITAARGVDLADAELAQARASLTQAQAELGRAEIRAPSDGILSERIARPGALAGGTEPLFQLIRNGEVELEADVPEADLPALASGQIVQVDVTGVADPALGRVRLVAPKVDRRTRIGHVRISLPAHPDFRPGVFARGTVMLERREAPVAVPDTALVAAQPDSATLFVVGDTGSVTRRRVEPGLRRDGMVEIRSGLSVGERVVLRAAAFLREGDHVVAVQAEESPGRSRAR